MENNNNEKTGKSEKNNKIEVSRKDSGGNNDNESNIILEKEESGNNKIGNNIEHNRELDSPSKLITDNSKKDFFFHDKDITEDSIIYFSNKLKQNNKMFKFYLYISISLYTIDIIFSIINKDIIFHSFLNFFLITTILICVIYQAILFRHNFVTISKKLYESTRRIIYIYNGIAVLFLINILYIGYNLIFSKKKDKNRKENFFDYPFVIFIYIGPNICVPIIHAIKLFNIKKSIKNLSAAKGEIYESAKIEEVQVINSIINEI